jgi:hypothetical protein
MFVMKLYRHLTGTDEDTRVEEERLRRNLNGMAKTNADLDRLDEELGDILDRVDEQGRRSHYSLPSGASGEHRLHLVQKEVDIHDGEEPPGES